MKIYEVDSKIAQTHADMLAKMKEEAVSFAAEFHDSVDNYSDWGHNYFCTDDGERLIFDLNKPHEHECQFCHKVYQTEILDNVWNYFYRNTAILTLLKLAVLYKIEKDADYIAEYKKILTFYAENYDKFPLHAHSVIYPFPQVPGNIKDAGRLMPQGLNESIVMIRIIISLEILKDDLDKEFTDMVVEKLLTPAGKDVLLPEVFKIHNKPCWAACAVGVIGLYTGNQELIDFAYDSELGLNNQMLQGVTDDKFWYEGSIHYNFFLLEGLVQFLAFSKIYEKPLAQENIIREMLIQGYDYAFDNDVFPNPNDGWPNLNLKSFDYSYALATKIFGEDSDIGNIYKNIRANPAPRVEVPLSKPYYFDNDVSFEQLVCVPHVDVENRTAIERKSVCYETSYFAKLKKDDINVFLKYGHASPSHAHPDKMNVEITINNQSLSRDISNTGYASNLCNSWHRKSLSHNTVVVDGQDHEFIVQGTVSEFSDTVCRSEAKESYTGVDFKRDIVLTDNGFTDTFGVVSNDTHNYDFIFHSEAELTSEVDAVAAESGYTENGYQHLYELKKVNCAGDSITLNWLLGDTKLESVIDVKDKELFIAKTFDNPASTYRTAFILREKTTSTTFNVVWNVL